MPPLRRIMTLVVSQAYLLCHDMLELHQMGNGTGASVKWDMATSWPSATLNLRLSETPKSRHERESKLYLERETMNPKPLNPKPAAVC